MNIKSVINDINDLIVDIESETSNWISIEFLSYNEILILEYSLLICKYISPKLKLEL